VFLADAMGLAQGAASALLSSRNSASMSSGSTYEASLSVTRCNRAMWPMDLTVPPELADTLRDRVGHGEELITLFVQQQVIIAEVRPAHVPVEVLGLQVEREHVRQDSVHGSGDIPTRLWSQVGGRDQRTQSMSPNTRCVVPYVSDGVNIPPSAHHACTRGGE
jgi:hypothetical protein